MYVESNSFHCRVVIIGDASVGKTSLLNQLIDHNFQEYEQSTIGANYQLYVEEIDGTKIEIQIWDTAGQEKFKSLGPIYYRNSLGAAVVFDVTNRKTFDDLSEWITSFTEVAGTDTTIVIVANKTDIVERQQVEFDEVKEWAESNGYMVFATSAKTGDGVTELFRALARDILTNRMMKSKQTRRLQPVQNESGCGC
ncbi:small GTP-binding protein [Tritrichomonas foetus]|uniref:Small GTP-binding protein n=1 Tax=Tritrichomonas foetus TaxID=1144522 RepID=A0A1J4JC27_9EUKA|nr:small GTP-binding protein [Tritrichomonas foetus]|eukprot:OHS94812.1 small GTP-binding protein [Tritrichomonas foetus]